MSDKNVKPYAPKKSVHIHIDLNDLTQKAVHLGPLHVLAEAILNLSLMANDHFTRIATRGAGPNGASAKEKSKDD